MAAQSSDEKEVAKAVEELRKAMIDPTPESLEKIIGNELTYGHSSGQIDDKSSFIKALLEKKSDFISIDLSEQTIKIVGNTAFVRHKLKGALADKEKTTNLSLGVLLIWVKDNGKWKLFARQGYKLSV
jgi:hypothetical protein